MKKITINIIIVLSLITCLVCSSCDDKTIESIYENNNASHFTHILNALPANYQLISGTFHNDKFYYTAQLKNNNPKLNTYIFNDDNQLIESENIEIDGYNFEGVSVNKSNTFYAVYSSVDDYCDIKLFKYNSYSKQIEKSIKIYGIPDSIIDTGEYIITTYLSESDYTVYRYNQNLELIDNPEIFGIPENDYIGELRHIDGVGYCCLLAKDYQAQLIFLNENFEYVSMNNIIVTGTCGYVLNNKSNVMLFQISDYDINFYEISPHDDYKTINSFTLNLEEIPEGIYNGYGNFDFLISLNQKIQGYNTSSKEFEIISELPNEYITDISSVSDDKYKISMLLHDELENKVFVLDHNIKPDYIDYNDGAYDFFIDQDDNYYFLYFEPERSYIIKKNRSNQKVCEINLTSENEFLVDIFASNQVLCSFIEYYSGNDVKKFVNIIDLRTNKVSKTIKIDDYEVLNNVDIIDICYRNNSVYIMSDEKIFKIDSENKVSIIMESSDEYNRGFISCPETYDLGFYSDFGIYKYNEKNHSISQIVCFEYCDINIMHKQYINLISDEEFYIVGQEDGNAYNELHRFIKSDNVPDSKTEITIAGIEFDGILYSDNFMNMIQKFNNSSDNLKISLKRYEDSESMQRDFLCGNIPDIVFTCGEEIWVSKYLADLSSYIENSKLSNNEEYFTNLLKLDNNCKPKYIFPSFSVYVLGGKSSEIGNTELWESEKYIKLINKNSKKNSVFGSEISNVISGMFISNMNSYIDYEKGICNFDNEKTYELLNSVKKLYGSFDSSIFENGVADEDLTRIDNRFINDECYIDFFCIPSPESLSFNREILMGDSVSYKGIPSSNKCSPIIAPEYCLGLLENSKNIDKAWIVIEQLFTDDNQKNIKSFPVKRSVFKKKIENSRGTKLSNNEISDFEKLLNKTSTIIFNDKTLTDILNSDIIDFINGTKDAIETAKIIQEKVELYLNERT